MENAILNSTKKRFFLLDELRGFMVFCMVFYHWFLSLYDIFEVEFFGNLFDFFYPVEAFFAGGFVLLSGIMCGYSRSNIKRGAILSVISILLSVVTIVAAPYVGNIEIYFGILHLLGFSMLCFGLFSFFLKRINKWVGLIVNVLLFTIFYGLPDHQTDLFGVRNLVPNTLKEIPWLFPLGITTENFSSADYFPLIPWIFLFFAGYYVYKFHIFERFEKIFLPSRVKFFSFLGRHALIIYIVHQPLIYILFWFV